MFTGAWDYPGGIGQARFGGRAGKLIEGNQAVNSRYLACLKGSDCFITAHTLEVGVHLGSSACQAVQIHNKIFLVPRFNFGARMNEIGHGFYSILV